jgi:hypothetical protein
MHRDRRASWRFKWAEEERKELEKGGARAEDIIRLLD